MEYFFFSSIEKFSKDMAFNTNQNLCDFFSQLVDKLTTDEDIQDVEFDLNDVSAWLVLYKMCL